MPTCLNKHGDNIREQATAQAGMHANFSNMKITDNLDSPNTGDHNNAKNFKFNDSQILPIKLSDYPRFMGNYEMWYRFWRQFEATALLQFGNYGLLSCTDVDAHAC